MGGGATPFVGLTGGIGAGKSEALAALGRLGAATLSTDTVVHELYASSELREALAERWGEDAVPGGEVDRAAVASIVFERPGEREWLEGLLWPRVGRRVAEWREEVGESDPVPPAAVVEVPLLFEAGMEGVFDATIAVTTDEVLRARRAEGRGHEKVDSRTSRQLSQREKAERADFVVPNDGSIEELEERLALVLKELERR
jgi:dephospho-CoA kinase